MDTMEELKAAWTRVAEEYKQNGSGYNYQEAHGLDRVKLRLFAMNESAHFAAQCNLPYEFVQPMAQAMIIGLQGGMALSENRAASVTA